MAKLSVLKQILETAKAEGCVRFPESKGYRGPGFSVQERLQALVTDVETPGRVMTKTAVKVLLQNDAFKSMRFNGRLAGESSTGERKGRTSYTVEIEDDLEETSVDSVAPATTAAPAETVAEAPASNDWGSSAPATDVAAEQPQTTETPATNIFGGFGN